MSLNQFGFRSFPFLFAELVEWHLIFLERACCLSQKCLGRFCCRIQSAKPEFARISVNRPIGHHLRFQIQCVWNINPTFDLENRLAFRIARLIICLGIISTSPFTGLGIRPTQTAQATGIKVHTTFPGSDRQTSLPATETGQRWEVFSGSWAVLHHRAHNSQNSTASKTGDGNDVAVIDAGVADCNVKVKLSGAMTNPSGIAFRAVDVQNFFFVRASTNSIEVFRKKAGAYLRLTTVANGVADGDILEVELRGSSIVVKVNGVERTSINDPTNKSATRHGLYSYDANVGFVEFSVDTRLAQVDWVRVTAPIAYQTYQRDDQGRADILISGTVSGQPKSVDARFNGGAWATIASTKDGKFSGVLKRQQAGQGSLEVRFSDKPDVNFRQDHVGIGEVFLVAGQSNAEGRITSMQSYAHPTLRASVFDEAIGWRDGYDPTDSTLPDQYSVWPLLATKIMNATDVPVAFITSGAPQTGLIGDGGTWAKGGPTYEKCLQMVRGSGVNGIRAVLWYQGESDANVPSMTESQYQNALFMLRRNLSNDLGWQLKLVTAQIAYLHTDTSKETRGSVDAVRMAQSSAPERESYILMGPIFYDLDIRTTSGGDGVHLRSPNHAQIVAARWWRMLRFYFYGGNEGRGPQFQSAQLHDPNTLEVHYLTSGGSLRASTPLERGWRVVDANGVRKILSAVVQSASSVRLTVDQPLSGKIELSWASYNDAVGLSLTDSGQHPLPAEPFKAFVLRK